MYNFVPEEYGGRSLSAEPELTLSDICMGGLTYESLPLACIPFAVVNEIIDSRA